MNLASGLLRAAAGGPRIITSDSFTGGDVANIVGRTSDAALGGTGATWASNTTTIGILSGQLRRNGGTGVRFAVLGGGVADVDVRATIAVLGTGTNYLVARWVDASNYYRVGYTSAGDLFVQKVAAAVSTTLTAVYTMVAGDVVGLRCVGTSIDLIKNGTVLERVTDTAFATGTAGVGYTSTEATSRLDDLIIRRGAMPPFP